MSAPTPGPLIAQGRTAEVYAWPDNQILKLFFAWYSQDMAQREIDIDRIVAATTLPVPKLIGAVEIDGRQGIIYERAEGPSMLKQLSVKPWLVFRLARQLADLHAEMHELKGDGLPPMRPLLQWSIDQGNSLPPQLKAGVLRLLETLPDGDALCHCDFHPDQVLITTAGPVIIDWLTALQGHPVADVARTCILLEVGQVPYAGWAVRVLINLWRGFFYRTYIARYLERHPGVTLNDVRTWMVPVAAARLGEHIEGEQKPLLRIIQSYLPMS